MEELYNCISTALDHRCSLKGLNIPPMTLAPKRVGKNSLNQQGFLRSKILKKENFENFEKQQAIMRPRFAILTIDHALLYMWLLGSAVVKGVLRRGMQNVEYCVRPDFHGANYLYV